MASNTVIRTNVLALNSHRNLGAVGVQKEKASTKLSSGYRINSAADDAAGLAISEKMRAQIRGLDMADKNTQDGISLIQTAEGGLQEIDSMIQRIRELVVQSANDTNDFTTNDRKKLQDEINQLTKGIDSMAGQVEFNAKKLLDGSLLDAGTKSELLGDIDKKLAASIGAVRTQSAEISDGGGSLGSLFTANSAGQTDGASSAPSVASTSASASGVCNTTSSSLPTSTATFATTDTSAGLTVSMTATETLYDSAGSSTGTSGQYDTTSGATVTFGSGTTTITGSASVSFNTTTNSTWTNTTASKPSSSFDGISYAAMDSSVYGTDKGLNDYIGQVNAYIEGIKSDWAANGKDGISADYETMMGKITTAQKSIEAASTLRAGYVLQKAQEGAYDAMNDIEGNGLWFQTGANSMQGVTVGVGSVKTDILGIGNGFGESTINVDQESGVPVSTFINVVEDALQYVTAQRAKLGAAQNRLEFTSNSLQISSENLNASESRVRNTDMAKEMMKLTQANIIQQAAISMLAQANQQPQSILQLLQ